MKICIIRNNKENEFTTISQFFNNLQVVEINLNQDDLNNFDELKEKLNVNSPDINTFKDLFASLWGCDDYLSDIAREICEWGYWIAENDGYNSIHYDSIRVIKYKEIFLSCSESQSDENISFVDKEFFRYLVDKNIDGITGIYLDATSY